MLGVGLAMQINILRDALILPTPIPGAPSLRSPPLKGSEMDSLPFRGRVRVGVGLQLQPEEMNFTKNNQVSNGQH